MVTEGQVQVKNNPAPRGRPEAWGIGAALLLALVANWLGGFLPLLGASITGLVLGIIIRQAYGLPDLWAPGVRLASKQVLKLAIVFLGAGMSLGQVWQTGSRAIVIILSTVILGLVVTIVLGRRFGISAELSQLIGVGTAICGATAIATTAPIIRANEEDTAYAVSTIFTFNLLAVFLYPLAGHLLGLTDASFGTWAGTAIQDTSSVVAAGYAYTDSAGGVATIVKLARTLFLVPVALLFGFLYTLSSQGNKDGGDVRQAMWKAFPTFLLGFLALALLRTADVLPTEMLDGVNRLGKFLVVVALVAVGLSSDLRKMKKAGFKPLLLGLGASATVGVVSLVLIRLVGID